MISFIEGTVEHVGDKFVIINAGGIGYKVTLGSKMISSLSKSTTFVNGKNRVDFDPEPVEGVKKIKLFTHSQMNMREGTFDLYGFKDREGLELFHILTTVSGIGPKGAMNILSATEPKQLKAAVVNEDADYLKRVSGLGAKTAQRIILELESKVDHLDMGDLAGVDLSQEGQVMDALLSLGFTTYQSKEALKNVKAKKIEERVREALKILGKR
jgi:holliday junction DNA helicase RuvA